VRKTDRADYPKIQFRSSEGTEIDERKIDEKKKVTNNPKMSSDRSAP
jgi:hypothetical protein